MSILLIFRVISYIIGNSALLINQIKYTKIINKTIAELKKLIIKKKINNILNIKNRLNIKVVLPGLLELKSEVFVFKE